MSGYYRLTEDQKRFLERLRCYKAQGVRIIIDGMELPERDWDRIFMLADRPTDGTSQFYMSDYVAGRGGNINEIHLDRVYVKNPVYRKHR